MTKADLAVHVVGRALSTTAPRRVGWLTPSRLVATAAEDRLNFQQRIVGGRQRLSNNRIYEPSSGLGGESMPSLPPSHSEVWGKLTRLLLLGLPQKQERYRTQIRGISVHTRWQGRLGPYNTMGALKGAVSRQWKHRGGFYFLRNRISGCGQESIGRRRSRSARRQCCDPRKR
jgi:hypothetical protein